MSSSFTHAILTLVGAFGAALIAHKFYKAIRWALHPWFSPLRDVPGPVAPSWLYGHIRQLTSGEMEILDKLEEFEGVYGRVFKFKGLFNRDRLVMMDTRALNHVLTHDMQYVKPERVRHSLGQVFGQGLLFVEGEKHKKQRKVMNPAFGPAQIRELTGIFVEKSIQVRAHPRFVLPYIDSPTKLRDLWTTELTTSNGKATIDVMGWLNKMTLDVIGLAGFSYSFDALNPDGNPNELNDAVRMMFAKPDRSALTILQSIFPPLRMIPSESQHGRFAAQRTMSRIGHQLITEKKAAVLASMGTARKETVRSKAEAVQGRDLLSLLIKANMAMDLPESARMDDDDVLAHGEWVDAKGVKRTGVRVSKGDLVSIPIMAINRSKTLWGEDAAQFKPERWKNPPDAVASIPGVWGNSLAFLGGNRACIGFRFSIIEMKALLFVLIRAFQFEMAVPVGDVLVQVSIVQRPFLKNEMEKGPQLPLLVTLV
ncbi:hypothetical protein EW146_g8504 [Bondarzewia mesenterica]|uniref:Cytochrome P450 n=1 Tax=Bondarzewia mesenterica TaxID=1095465 RepID=A0A4S4LFM3_9AGAM|nr:hypothetical protein EW146_g8504 [Bondarzewia mesenterica]